MEERAGLQMTCFNLHRLLGQECQHTAMTGPNKSLNIGIKIILWSMLEMEVWVETEELVYVTPLGGKIEQ